jgi:hypothetical protein
MVKITSKFSVSHLDSLMVEFILHSNCKCGAVGKSYSQACSQWQSLHVGCIQGEGIMVTCRFIYLSQNKI